MGYSVEFTPESLTRGKRYDLVTRVLQDKLSSTALVENKPFISDDESTVRKALVEVAKFADPKVNSTFPLHLLATSLAAGKIAERLQLENVDPTEIRVLSLFHDIGVLLEPAEYLRKDLVGTHLMKKVGIREEIIKKIPDVPAIIGVGSHLIEHLEQLPIATRILDIADGFMKFSPDGKLLPYEQIIDYLSQQPKRYQKPNPFPSTRKGLTMLERGGQTKALKILQEEIKWIEEKGINIKEVFNEVAQEMERPENKEWIIAFQDAQQTLDPKVDIAPNRLPVTTIIFDVGNVLLTAPDELVIARLADHFQCEEALISNFFNENVAAAMSGEMPEENFLRKFYEAVNCNYPRSIEEAREPFVHPDVYTPIPGMQEIVQALVNNPRLTVRFQSDVIPSFKNILFQKLKDYYPFINPEHLFASCDIGCAKRQRGSPVYGWLHDLLGNPKRETVLAVDDSMKYVDAASGIHGFRRHHFRFAGDQNPAARLREELIKAAVL